LTLRDRDQYAIGTGLIQDEVTVNNPLTVVQSGRDDHLSEHACATLGALTTDGFEVIYRERDHAAVGTFTLSDDVVHVWQFERNEPPTEHDYAGDSGAAFRP